MMVWIKILVLSLIESTSLICILLILKLLFGCRLRLGSRQIIISAAASYILHVVLVGLIFPLNETANFVLMMLMLIACTVYLSEDKKFRNTLMLIPAVLVYVEWSGIISLLERMTGLDRYVWLDIAGAEITPLFFLQDTSLLIFLGILTIKADKKLLEVRLTTGEAIFLTLFCLFEPFLEGIFEGLEKYFQKKTYTLAWCVFILALNCAVAYGIAYRKRAKYYKLKSENYKTQFKDEYTYFQDYKDQQSDTAKFRHDFNNHVLVMQDMFNAGEYEKAKEYFSQVYGKQGISDGKGRCCSKILTGNEMADILISAKTEEMQKNDIELSVEGSLAPLSVIEPVDMCILLSNLLDNAIEANQKYMGKRYIKIRTGSSDVLFTVMITNPTQEVVKMNRELPVTTKTDKEKHGFGLSNVREIVAKYDGEMQFKAVDNTVSVKLLLPINND
ncbi:MAG: sensor histidine kinase [Coprococcus sp.]